jgi:16S rRNA (uracil1498-N3)-methyltransferase
MRRIPVNPQDFPSRAANSFVLPAEAGHHMTHVLRLSKGTRVEIFDGAGNVCIGRIAQTAPDTVLDELTWTSDANPQKDCGGVRITLVQALPKQKRWEWVLEKATELGVHRIVAVASQRSVVDIDAARHPRKLARWTKIVQGAARQSGRSWNPSVYGPTSVEAAVRERDEDLQFLASLSPEASSLASTDFPTGVSSVALWIGPEGGFNDSEIGLLSQNAQSVSLGPRTLRAETASLVGLTLIQSICGDLA